MPVMDRVGREISPRWPKENRVCFGCNTGTLEDVRHFIMDCPLYADKRAHLTAYVGGILENSMADLTTSFGKMSRNEQYETILGKRV